MGGGCFCGSCGVEAGFLWLKRCFSMGRRSVKSYLLVRAIEASLDWRGRGIACGGGGSAAGCDKAGLKLHTYER